MGSTANFPAVRPRNDARGHLRGAGLLGAIDMCLARFGRSASHEVIARLTPAARAMVAPHEPSMGISPGRLYPYAVVGDIIRTFAKVASVPEDVLIRDAAIEGVDRNLSSLNRALLRYLVSIDNVAARAQQTWDMFHDSGRLVITACTRNEYVVETYDWPSHDVTVCKLSMEGRRHIVELSGKKSPKLWRDKCQAYGQDVCVSRVVW